MSVRMSRLTTSQQQDSQEEVLQNLQIRLDKILSESRGDPSASFTSSHRRKTSLTASTHSTVPVRSSRRTHGVFLSSLRSIFNFLRWLIDTWTRVAVSLTTVLYQPLDLFSLLFWATAASAILGAILVFELVAQIPVISGALDDLTDYLVAGPKSETSGLRKLYSNFSPELRESAYRSLSKGVDNVASIDRGDIGATIRHHSVDERIVDLDAAKLLLALAALMYERSEKHRNTSRTRLQIGSPKHERSCGETSQDGSETGEADIRRTARFLGLRYHSVVELRRHAGRDHPVVGIFYAPSHPDFIVVAFKGTSPTNFSEWIVDFSYNYVDSGEWLGPGYGRVHQGFYSALYPVAGGAYFPGGVTPYEHIRRGVVEATQSLRKLNGGKDVNVYVTGHSLGAALASMFYARAVARPDDFYYTDPSTSMDSSVETLGGAIIRDLVVWGAPIFGDPHSLGAFNYSMFPPAQFRAAPSAAVKVESKRNSTLRDPPTSRAPSETTTSSSSQSSTTMPGHTPHEGWRINNHSDAVGTLLPALGDKGGLGSMISTTNQFNYSHIGQEIQLRSGPEFSLTGPGTLLVPGTPVRIISTLPKADSFIQLDLPSWLVRAQRIPLLGRLLAHAPVLYADQLNKIRVTKGDKKLPWAPR